MSEKITKLGIYGGTFSPIHFGHMKAALEFLRGMELDKLLVIPTAKPPHKAEVAGASSGDRLSMTMLAFSECEEYKEGKIQVSDFEIAKGDKSYTVHTLEHFHREGQLIYLLMGTDMFLTLDRWYRAEDIFALAEIVLFRREDEAEALAEIEKKSREYKEKFAAGIHVINGMPIEISSTELRGKISRGEDISKFVPEKVCGYISEKRLYK